MLVLFSIAIFAASLLAALLCLPAIRKRSLERGHIDHPGGRKDQPQGIPYGAGFAVLIGFAFPIAAGLTIAWLSPDLAPELVSLHGPGLQEKSPLIGAILLGASVMLLMGRFDDRLDLHVGIRFLIQVGCALLVTAAGVRVTLFVESVPIQYAITVAWLVFVTNAHNFIDNMDGLLAGCGTLSALAMAVIAGMGGQLFVCAFALALGGALAGILPYNKHPASIYLGDEGSMFVGFLLACLATLLTYTSQGSTASWKPFLIPLLVMVVPLVDGGYVISSRLLRGKKPWAPGQDHLSHRLTGRGHTKRSSVRILWLVSFAGGGIAILLRGLA